MFSLSFMFPGSVFFWCVGTKPNLVRFFGFFLLGCQRPATFNKKTGLRFQGSGCVRFLGLGVLAFLEIMFAFVVLPLVGHFRLPKCCTSCFFVPCMVPVEMYLVCFVGICGPTCVLLSVSVCVVCVFLRSHSCGSGFRVLGLGDKFGEV